MLKKTDNIEFEALFSKKSFKFNIMVFIYAFKAGENKKTIIFGEMAEWSIASDLKSDEPNKFREFKSHSLLFC